MSDTPRRVRARQAPATYHGCTLQLAIGQTVHLAAECFANDFDQFKRAVLATSMFGDELVRVATLCFNNPGKTHTCSFGALSFNKTTQQMELK